MAGEEKDGDHVKMLANLDGQAGSMCTGKPSARQPSPGISRSDSAHDLFTADVSPRERSQLSHLKFPAYILQAGFRRA
jgi:hypothetical protein